MRIWYNGFNTECITASQYAPLIEKLLLNLAISPSHISTRTCNLQSIYPKKVKKGNTDIYSNEPAKPIRKNNVVAWSAETPILIKR